MKLDELRKLAEAAIVRDHNETPNWYRYDDLIRDVIFYPKNAAFIAATNPTTVIQLLDLIAQCKEALDWCVAEINRDSPAVLNGRKALATIERFEQGETK